MSNIGVTVICPLLGTIICNVMWIAPMRAILTMRKNESIGDLNPIPWCITIVNCIGWSTYGLLRRDIFIFLSNCFGLLLGLFYCMSGISVMSIDKNSTRDLKKEKNIVEGLVIGAVSMWLFVGLIVGIATSPDPTTRGHGITAIGVIGDLCGLAYYAAPLSTMREVIRKRDSSSLYIPSLFANLGNALMWIVYGIAGIHDPLVWVPNLLGGLLTCSQLTLCILYPRKKNNDDNSEPTQVYMMTSNDNVIHNPLMTVVVEKQEIVLPVYTRAEKNTSNDKTILKETELEDDLI